MKLIMTPTSPYARKARVVILEKNINCEMIVAAPWDDDPQVLAVNPLRKVPVLQADDNTCIYDSRVICEYLDAKDNSPRFLPTDTAARAAVKTREALVEGAMDSALAIVMAGRAAPDMIQHPTWRAWLMDKTSRALAVLETDIEERDDFDISDVACFCFLDFLLFRKLNEEWRDKNPRLATWFDSMAGRECFVRTDPRKT